MLVIRLQRTGRRNAVKFRVVLQESSQAPKSAAKEILGSYDPHGTKREDQIILKKDRILHWISVGAQPSNTVHNMLVEFDIIDAPKKRSVQPKKKGKEGAEEKKEEAPAKEATEEKPEEKKDDKKEEAAE